MKTGKIFTLLLAVMITLTLCSCGTPSSSGSSDDPSTSGTFGESSTPSDDGKVYTLRYASNDSAEADRHIYFEEGLKAALEEKSGGRLTLEIYPSGSLSKPGSVLSDLKAGTVDIGLDNGTQYPGVYLYTELWGTAGLNYGDYDTTAQVLREFSEEYAAAEYKDVKLLAQVYSGAFSLITKRPITSVADFSGLSVRTTSNYGDWCDAMGGTIVSMTSSEVYEALRLNVIDSTMTSFSAITVFNFHEICDYVTLMPMVAADAVVAMSQATYDALPADLQAVIDDCIEDVYAEWNNYMHITEDKCRNTILEENQNLQIIDLSDEAIADFCEKANPSLEAKAAELNAAGLDGDGALAWLRERAQ